MAGQVTVIKKNGKYAAHLTKSQIADIESNVRKAQEIVESRGKQDPVFSKTNTLSLAQSNAKKGRL